MSSTCRTLLRTATNYYCGACGWPMIYEWWWWRHACVFCYSVWCCEYYEWWEFPPNLSAPNNGERAKSWSPKQHFGQNMKRENSGKVCISIDLVATSSVRCFVSKKDRQKLRKSFFSSATNKLTRYPPFRPPRQICQARQIVKSTLLIMTARKFRLLPPSPDRWEC